MKKRFREEELTEEWDLKTPQKIRDKLFEKEDRDRLSLTTIFGDGDIFVACSYALGRILARESGLKTAQLRRFYEALLTIRGSKENEIVNRIKGLKPQLANAYARQKREIGPFFEIFNHLLDRVYDSRDYQLLCQFAEAVVAYHNYHGGR